MSLNYTLKNILGDTNFLKLQKVKKIIFPTKFDKEQKAYFNTQVDFYKQLIKSNSLVFDIGANVGFKAKVFLALGAKVIAIEPQLSCVEILKKELGKKATIISKGVGAINEVKDFFVSNNTQLSSFLGNWVNEFKEERFKGSDIIAVEKIEIITLDSLINEYGNPDFIKIDVEGFELDVLKGLTKNFKCLSFEYTVPEKTENLIACLGILNKLPFNLIYNYVTMQNSFFENKEWVNYDKMLELVENPNFSKNFAGDIYIKQKNNELSKEENTRCL